jgi:hypothetical protein
MLTAYVARTLALTRREGKEGEKANAALARALGWLAPQVERYDEPYLIASYALAVRAANNHAAFERAVARLRRLSKEEAGMRYWMLETNTPFYGWGTAGRVETTALVLQAIAAASDRNDQELLSGGQLFLLKMKDRYGVWYSTQATVNVLDSLGSMLTLPAEGQGLSFPVDVRVNGKPAQTVQQPEGDDTSPLVIDLSPFLSPGENRVELRRPAGASGASAQLLVTYFLPWERPADEIRARAQGSARTLELSVRYARTEAAEGDTIECTVEVQRIGHRGYGMLLAEIGLPPGVEVQRESLERTMQASWEIGRYDVLPDRLVVYVWPRAGGTKFSFTFKPRMGLKALTAPSQLYDYYNPEARALLAPVRFTVQETPALKPPQVRAARSQ